MLQKLVHMIISGPELLMLGCEWKVVVELKIA
jgi:hypothetical protein